MRVSPSTMIPSVGLERCLAWPVQWAGSLDARSVRTAAFWTSSSELVWVSLVGRLE